MGNFSPEGRAIVRQSSASTLIKHTWTSYSRSSGLQVTGRWFFQGWS